MKTYSVAILGATGAVGQEMLRVLEEREFPVGKLTLLAGAHSAGQTLMFRGQPVPVHRTQEAFFAGVDLVLGAVDGEMAKHWAPAIRKAGAVFIDNSSAFRLDPKVPLVVPEVNGGDAGSHVGILANPNCTTIITLTAVYALERLSPIRRLGISSYQAASGAGAAGLAELQAQVAAVTRGETPQAQVFAHPLAYNVIPQIGAEQEAGYTAEEMKLHYEGRKILHRPDFKASCTCVRVPVLRSHSVSVRVGFDRPVSVAQAREAIAGAPGCRLVDDLAGGQYPMPLDATGQDLVLVGRIRQDLTDPNSLLLWCCGDQLRKGAATNAVQIAELLVDA